MMKRRDFLKVVSLATIKLSALAKAGPAGRTKSDSNQRSLKGFIVSDAHFGWRGNIQPEVSKQIDMMGKILQTFPDLDVFIDTGDAHHSYAENDDKGNWTDVIPGGCPQLPFFFVTGNHEVMGTGRGFDPEFTSNILGSVACRPYYSFDLCGIHFISMPELVRAVYINEETIRWVRMDMELNKDKTTILLSHNNIIGTTSVVEPGYRGVINSDEIMELLKKYPNAIAWMHGHNHDYDIMEKHNKMFVSNGRIGGFDPSGGKHGLGGIYFEIDNKQLKVAGYSAEFDCYLDELEDPVKTRTLRIHNSTFDPEMPASYSYGTGAATDGQRIPVFHHEAARTGKTELFLGGLKGSVLNDDPTINLFTIRPNPRGGHWQIMGSHVTGGGGESYDWADPGLELKPVSGNTRVVIPRRGHHEYTYYRLSPDRKYKVSLDLDSQQGGQKVHLRMFVHNRDGDQLASIDGPEWVLEKGKQIREAEIDIPSLQNKATIYTDIDSDQELNISAEATFSDLQNKVLIKKFALSFADAENVTKKPALIVDNRKYEYVGTLDDNEIASFKIPGVSKSRSVYEAQCEGNKRFVWLIRQTGCDWQVRNAPVADKGGHLEIGPMRNRFQKKPHIVIAPTRKTSQPYINRLHGVERAKVYPLNRNNNMIGFDVIQTSDSTVAKVDIVSRDKPSRVVGSDKWDFKEGLLIIETAQGQQVRVEYS